MSNIAGTLEILGAIGSHDEAAVKAVGSQLDAEVKTVSNSANEIHLTLPYYSDLNTKASAMKDSDLEGASGGDGAIIDANASATFSNNMMAMANFAYDAASAPFNAAADALGSDDETNDQVTQSRISEMNSAK